MRSDRWLLAWALGNVGLGGASLLVPLYVVAIGGDAAALGTLAATAALAAIPGSLGAGRLADRPGRRRVCLVGALAAVGASLCVLPFVTSLALVVAANAVIWFAAAAAAPVLTLLVTVGVPESEWPARFGVLNTYQGWGWVGGLVLGMVWTAAGARLTTAAVAQRTFFVACGVCAAIAAVAVGRWLPAEQPTETRPPGQVARALARARRFNVRGGTSPVWPVRLYWPARGLDPRAVVRRFTPTLSLYFVGVGLFFAGSGAFFAPLPLFLAEAVGLGSDAVFGLYLASALGSAVLYVAVGDLTARYDAVLLQTGALGARTALFPAIALLGGAASLAGFGLAVAAFLALGVTWAVIAVTGTTLVTRLAPDAIRGEVLGVYGALTGLAGAIGSALGGLLAAQTYALAFGVAGALVLGGAAVVLSVRRVAGAWTGRSEAA